MRNLHVTCMLHQVKPWHVMCRLHLYVHVCSMHVSCNMHGFWEVLHAYTYMQHAYDICFQIILTMVEVRLACFEIQNEYRIPTHFLSYTKHCYLHVPVIYLLLLLHVLCILRLF